MCLNLILESSESQKKWNWMGTSETKGSEPISALYNSFLISQKQMFAPILWLAYEDCPLGFDMHGYNTPEIRGNAVEVVRFSKKLGIKKCRYQRHNM